MDKIIAVGIGIAVGWWLRGCSEDRRRLKEENAALVSRIREREGKEG